MDTSNWTWTFSKNRVLLALSHLSIASDNYSPEHFHYRVSPRKVLSWLEVVDSSAEIPCICTENDEHMGKYLKKLN